MDVHIFDGKLKDFHIEKGRIKDSDKKQMFGELAELLDQDAKNGLSLIISNEGNKNYDNSNDMYADDILAEICEYIIKETDDVAGEEDEKGEEKERKERLKDVKNIIENINEQLKDMFLTGQCAQGRTIRLWQILKYIRRI